MDLKVLLQAIARVWLIEENAAYLYADLLQQIIDGKTTDIKAGLFDDAEAPYRVNSRANKTEKGEVLVIPVAGPLMKNDFCGEMGTATMAKMVRNAPRDNSLSAIVLKMDTPGGTVDGTEDFANAIAEAKQKIPVIGYVERACSAGNWIVSACTEIILQGQTAVMGSLGTMATMRDTRKADESRGTKTVNIFATRSVHKNRAALEALEGKPDNYIKEILDPMNAAFEAAVNTNRKGKIDYAKEDVFTGKVYFGNDAVKYGLADTIGNFDYAVKRSLQMAKSIK